MTVATLPQAHPAKGLLAIRRITVRKAAQVIGVHELVLGRMLNGLEKPSPRIRAGLTALLEVPEEQLFTRDAA